ncbi:MAG: hypothetical protein EOP02_34800 [Proteobacteria bacterium]|nr:MAG: hypothetical protein EOP02_34800 [Pseudomonadota bacterium]
MRAIALALAFIPFCAGAALAGPMPVLPDLPPLPTNYDQVGGGGFYAGLLTGLEVGSAIEHGAVAGVVVGNTMMAADLLLGAEVIALADMHGDGSLEAGLRLGIPINDSWALFGSAGLGFDWDRKAFAVVGLGTEIDIGNAWALRADYRLNLDLNGEPATHRLLTGLVKKF